MTPNGTAQGTLWRLRLDIPSLLKRDQTRRIDRLIDYFGEPVCRMTAAAPRLPPPVLWRKAPTGAPRAS